MRGFGCSLMVIGVALGLWAVVPGGPYKRENNTGFGIVASGLGGLMVGWKTVRRKRAGSTPPGAGAPACPKCGRPAEGRFCAYCGSGLA